MQESHQNTINTILPDPKYNRKQLQDVRGITFLTDGPSCVPFPLINVCNKL